MKPFITPDFEKILHHAGLRDFEQIWDLKRDWREPPNVRRGGTSGVCRKEWIDPATGEAAVFYVKFQENHCCRGWTNPMRDMPTARREFKNLRFFKAHGIRTAEEVYYREDSRPGRVRAILITRALPGCDLFECLRRKPMDEALSASLAELFFKIHRLGYRHEALEPDHIWMDGGEPIVIDLEFARRLPWRPELPTIELKKFFRALRKKCAVPLERQKELLLRYLTLAKRPETLDKWAEACELKERKSLRRRRLVANQAPG